MESLQQQIIKSLNVKPVIHCEPEIKERVDFLASYLLRTGKRGFVLSISGGQDSALAGKLTQMAVEKLRHETKKEYTFMAVRLPYGIQSDEDELQLTYEEIDDYLEAKPVPEEIRARIERKYIQTEHKRRTPVTPADTWWV